MKNFSLVLLLLIITVSSYGQTEQSTSTRPGIHCSNYITDEYDKITGVIVTGGKMTLSEKKGPNSLKILMQLGALHSTYMCVTLEFTVNGTRVCAKEGDKINILFKDGTRQTYENEKGNCESDFWLFTGTDPMLKSKSDNFHFKKIDAIRLNSSSEIYDFNFSDAEAEKFNIMFGCLVCHLGENERHM